MSLANPAALAWSALAAPIVVFYILKIRLRRVPVSTILFWRQIFEEKQPRSIWQTLRHLLSLLVQLTLLATLVFALAEPYFHWEIVEARKFALVIDDSASTRATDVAPSRLAKIKDEARRIVDGLRFRDEMTVIAAGTQPRVLCGLTNHHRALLEAVDGVSATDGPTRVDAAVELARKLIGSQKNHTILVLTDGGFDGLSALLKAADVEVRLAATPHPSNVGITRFQARRSLLDPVGYEILAEVFNASDESVACRFEVDLNDNPIDVVPLKIEPGGTWRQVFEKTSTEGGRLAARLDHDDALAVDNLAEAILPRREVRPVTLVTPGNLFLEKVFEANPLVKLVVAKALDQAPRTSGGLIVLHREVPAKLPPGPLFVIEPTTACDLWDVGPPIQNPVVAKQDRDSELMAHVRLDNVLMPEARRLVLKAGAAAKAKILASSIEGEPLFFSVDRPEGKVLLLTVNLDKGDLPLQTAFPILSANALGWFSNSRGELRPSPSTGDVVSWTPTTRGPLVLRAPDGKTRPLPNDDKPITLGPFDLSGVWRVEHVPTASVKPSGTDAGKGVEAGAPEFVIACNLANRDETDLRPRDVEALKRPSPIPAGFGGRPVWYILILLAWLLAAFEWFLYQRRWIS